MIGNVRSDVRYALRSLVRRPTFFLAVVGTLALGIGANTAVFSLIDAVVLRPLALEHVDRLVTLFESATRNPYGASAFSTFRTIRERDTGIQESAAIFTTSVWVADADAVEEHTAALVTDNYFRILGVRAGRGRLLGPGDTASAASRVAVISHRLWTTRFGANAAILGRPIKVAGQTVSVVGVAAERFDGTSLVSPPDLWLPVSLVPSLQLGGLMSRLNILDASTDVRVFTIIGRLRPGASIATAERDVNSVVSSAAEVLGARGHFIVVPINQGATSLRDRADLLRFMRLLFSVVAATLLLACLNIANLLFVRGKERAKEIGVRAALGAGSGRLARELMTESVLLATAGGIAGLIAGELALRLLSAFALPGGVTIEQLHLGVNGRVLAFTAGLSVLTAVAFGLLPALHGSRVNVVSVIRDEAFASASSPGRGALLALQVAISLVLLVAAALMVRSLRRGLETDLGFDPSHLAAVSVQPQLDGRQADNARLADEVLRVVRASPGIQSAAATSHLPLGPSRALPFAPGAAGTVPAAARRTVMLYLASVSPDYFRVLGVPVVQGRGFGGEDRTDASRVVVLNESAAQSFFPGESPIGKQINFLDDRTYTVVGVVRDTKYVSLQDRSVAFAFAPLAQEEVRGTLMFVVRADEPHVALRAVQNAVTSMAPAWKLMRPRVVRDQVNAVLMPQRVGAVLLSVFAFVALVVSGVGIYGTVAYAMERRRSEIGVRMALGAQSFDVLRLVLREFSSALAAGLALGLVGGAVAAKLLSHFLYQIDPLDLPSFSAGICGVLIAAMTAVLVPSARALNVDPVCAMRSQ